MTAPNSKQYWDNYYKKVAVPDNPSLFAKYVKQNYLHLPMRIAELGSGNSRDANYFAKYGYSVVAYDQCNKDSSQRDELVFVKADFTHLPDVSQLYDVVYSRFTMHAVDIQGQERSLRWAQRNLHKHGILAIEARGQKNELYRRGVPVDDEADSYIYENHYRRFLNLDTLNAQVNRIGFRVIESSECAGYAPYAGTDYHFIRLVAKKS